MSIANGKDTCSLTEAMRHWAGNSHQLDTKEWPARHPFRWFESLRNRQMAERYTERVAQAISRRLSAEVSLNIRKLSRSMDFSSPASGGEEGSVLIQFRIFNERILVFMPFELVQDLNSIARKKPLTQLCSIPGNEELTTISCLLAETLTENHLFNQHRIYLSAVGVWLSKSAGAVDDEKSSAQEDKISLSTMPLRIDVNLNGYKYEVMVRLSSEVCKRIIAYGSYQPISTWGKSILQHKLGDCKLVFRQQLSSYLTLLEFVKGKRLNLSFSTDSSGEESFPIFLRHGSASFLMRLSKTSRADKLICKVK